MGKQIENANHKPTRWFGMHMIPGCAEYREEGKTPYRIFLNENTIKNMDRTFEGCPVYVQHVEQVDLSNLETEAAGIVVKSFWNASDGKTWCEFIVFSDAGHAALKRGWRLSNAYKPTDWGGPGCWNGIDYQRQVTGGQYEHLALVPNPRYDESIVLSPDEFKNYNETKNLELKRLANARSESSNQTQGEQSVLTFFKRAKVENSMDFENTLVSLPNSKVDKSVGECVAIADTFLNMHCYACNEHMVKANDKEEMSVGDLVNKYNESCKKNADMQAEKEASELAKKNEDQEEKKEGDGAKKAEKEVEADDKKKNAADAADDLLEAKAKKLAANNKVINAEKNATASSSAPVLNLDKTAVGKAKYGSTPVVVRK